MRYRQRTGFTLIELLVVIAIIAILAAILFPVFLMAKRSANASACLSNLRQIGSATSMYTDNNGGFFPNKMNGFPRTPYVDVWDGLAVYIRNTRMFVCKADAIPAFNKHWSLDSPSNQGQIAASDIQHEASYYYTCHFYAKGGFPSGPPWTVMPRHVSEVLTSTRKIVFQCMAVDKNLKVVGHSNDGTQLLFVDGHAGLISFGRLKQSQWGPDRYTGSMYNLDWTADLDGSDFK